MPGPFYFAYVDEGVAFNAVTHAVEDEPIFSLEIAQSEGDFATLTIEVPNPTVGLLSAGRNLWCWLSHDAGAGPVALFNGRLIGVPQKLADEVVALQFVARPADYIAQKTAVGDTLKVLPWYDPIWLQDRLDDLDAVLETRAALWDINRVTLAVTTTNIVTGEAGTIAIGEADHFYDEIDVSYSDAPLRKVAGKLDVTWSQAGTGELDLTRQLVAAFQAGGSPTLYPMVSSLTGPGLFDDWPEPGKSIGEGWSIAADATFAEVTWINSPLQTFVYTKPRYQDVTVLNEPGRFVGNFRTGLYWKKATTTPGKVISGYDKYALIVPLSVFVPDFRVAWDASRQRQETVTFTVEADTQSLLVDPGAAETATIELHSNAVDQPVDTVDDSPGAADLPIGNPLSNTYFKLDRGAKSLEYALLLARALLITRARAVRIKITTPFLNLKTISCRHNIALTDRRLPGGVVTGKVAAYSLVANGEGAFQATATLACTIGHGVAIGAALGGTPDYVEDGYVTTGYQTRTGGEAALIAGELLYEHPNNFAVVDDGLDLTNVSATNYLVGITVTDGPNAQRQAIINGIRRSDADNQPVPPSPRMGVTILYGDVGQNDEFEPSTLLENHPTTVSVEMVPIGKRNFAVTFTPTVSQLVIQKTIDLEAA